MKNSDQSITYASDIKKQQRDMRIERFFASPNLIIGAIMFLIIALIAFIIPALSSTDPNAVVAQDRLLPPSSSHWFGTDEYGRDLFARVMWGAQSSLWVGFSVSLFSCLFGVIIGILASYYSWLDQVLMRLCDGFMSIPGIYNCLCSKCCTNGSGSGACYKRTTLC